jgi:hypothetical protein
MPKKITFGLYNAKTLNLHSKDYESKGDAEKALSELPKKVQKDLSVVEVNK